MVTPFFPTMYLKNSTVSTWNTDFFRDTAKSWRSSLAITCFTSDICSASVFEYSRMSSKYTTTLWSKNSHRIVLIIVWKGAGAVPRLKGITLYS